MLRKNGNNREGEVEGEKDEAAASGRRWGALQKREDRQNDDDRAKIDNLPLKVAAIGFVGAHARGRIPERKFSKPERERGSHRGAGFQLAKGGSRSAAVFREEGSC